MQTADADRLRLRICSDPGLYAPTTESRIALPHKSLVLLTYLTLESELHTRAHLATLLWAESDEAHASMSLRQALSKLRDVLGEALSTDRTHVRLAPSAAPRCDALDFVETLERSTVPSALPPVHRALDGLAIDGGSDFGHWADRTRARLLRRATVALQRLSLEMGARRNWAQQLRVAEQWMELAPVSADAACTAIEAAFRRRDAARALAICDAFVRRMTADGLLSESVRERIGALERRYDGAGWRTPSHGVATVPSAATNVDSFANAGIRTPFGTTLHERDSAWQAISAAFDWATTTQSATHLVLEGCIGSGRTRMLDDVAAYAKSRDATVLCTRDVRPAAAVPYSAIATLVRDMLDVPGLGGIDETQLKVLQALVPEISRRFPQLRTLPAQDTSADAAFALRLQEVLTQAIASMAEDATLVFVLDDHLWYDRESAAILLAIMRKRVQLPLLWVTTTADDQIVANGSPAWAEATQLGKRVPLPALSAQSIAQMCGEFSGIADNWGVLAERVQAATHGLPGFVVACIENLRAAQNDDWRAIQTAAVRPPALPLRQRQYIESLDDVTRTVLLSLAMVAEAGHPVSSVKWTELQPLTLDMLSHVHGISRLRAAVEGQRLVSACLAQEVDSGFRCSSPIVVDYMLTTGSTLVRDEVRWLVGRYVAAAGAPPANVLRSD